MKHLKKHALIFDAECPMCNAYSSAFIKAGMLDKDGREAYQQMSAQTCSLIDPDKARNEIALVNYVSGEVYYGIDSLFKVISNSYPLLQPLFGFPPFRWLMKKLYSFISYNRKVIIPAKANDSCVPDLNTRYRWLYLVFTWLVTSLVLTRYSLLMKGVVPESHFLREFMICGGQLVFQSAVLGFLAPKRMLEYMGNMMTVSFVGSFLLLVAMAGGKLAGIVNPWFYTGTFLCVAGLMLAEHARRMKITGIPTAASITWVIYRLIVLVLIYTA